MKLYCKIKRDGIWNWMVADDPWKVATARALCECRVCRSVKPETISQEDCPCNVDVFGNRIYCKGCSVEPSSSEEEE